MSGHDTLRKKGHVLEQDVTALAASLAGRPHWGTARFEQDMRLMLHFLKYNEALVINMHAIGKAIAGRYDPNSPLPPDIDLTVVHAADEGVSRNHVELAVADNTLRITDMGSMNGTSINGKLLKAHQPALLRDGDELQLGLLRCMVFFQKTS